MSNSLQTQVQEAGASAPAGTEQFLAFRCMGMSLALPISRIREIIELAQMTTVPNMPAYVRGVINLRGNVVSVVDLAARLSGTVGERGRRSCIVIVELDVFGEMQRVGLLVDAVDAVLDIDLSSIEPPPRFGAGLRSDGIAGMARREEGFTVILKPDQIIGEALLDGLGSIASRSTELAPAA